MGLKIYRGEAFEHTHENRFFDYLCDALTVHCDDLSHNWHLLGNVHVGSRELDALLIKNNAVIALDFKDYGGKLEFSEAGPWKIKTFEGQGIQVKGGASVNPFVQLKKNKRALTEFFQRQFPDLDCNWGHIAAAVVFQQSVEIDYGTIPGHLNRWFHITDQVKFVRDLENIVSREILFDYDDQDQIPDLLGIDFYKVPKVRSSVATRSTRVVDDATNVPDDGAQSHQLTTSQREALTEFATWLSSKMDVFQLNGMVNTGKRELLPVLQSLAAEAGYIAQFVAPSKRIARRYAGLDIDIISIYTFLYSLSPTSIVEEDNKKIAIHQLVEPKNIGESVVFVLDAHLFSDSELQKSDRRYGSGRLISDLLNVIKEHGGRLVCVGDPYQLSRTGEESSLVHSNIFKHYSLMSSCYELNEQLSNTEDSALRDLQLSLVNALKQRRFNNLAVHKGAQIRITDGAKNSWKPNVKSGLPHSIMLASTRLKASEYNTAVKTRMLGHNEGDLIAVDDWIDFYNRTPVLMNQEDIDDPFLLELQQRNIQWIDSGAIGKVVGVLERELITQNLRGRSEPVSLNFLRLRVVVKGLGEVECRCLMNFTKTTENEISTDEMIALSIIARDKAKGLLDTRKALLPEKGSPDYKDARKEYDLWEHQVLQGMGYSSAGFVKPAHSMTVHRSQGRAWPEAWINAQEGVGGEYLTNKGYFQWLYTASLAAQDLFVTQNPPFISPLSNVTKITRDKSFKIQYMQVKRPFYFDAATAVEKFDTLDSSFRISDRVKPIAVSLVERAQKLGLVLSQWNESQYRVQASLGKADTSSTVTVTINYNKDLYAKSFQLKVKDLGGLPSDSMLSGTLQGDFKPSNRNSLAIFESIEQLFNQNGFNFLAVVEHSYQFLITVEHGQKLADLKVSFNGEGFVSRLALIQADSESIVQSLEALSLHDPAVDQ